MKMSTILILQLLILVYSVPYVFGGLEVGFYGSSCPKAESITQQVVQHRFSRVTNLTAALVRLQFHDCFVNGCDASILINSTNGKKSEKEAFDNLNLRGFDVIDEIKQKLETSCPLTVSCADIIAMATRDVVGLAGGPKYDVPTGRRDGLISNKNDVVLPQPDTSLDTALKFFTDRGLTLDDMVTLLGAHTVGVAHCSFFDDRFGPTDPGIDPALKAKLDKLCSFTTLVSLSEDDDPFTFLDQNTSFVFDNSIYNELLRKRGILELDQRLAVENSTTDLVSKYAVDNVAFLEGFAKSIVKMGTIQVLTGQQGQIRKFCSVVN